MSGLPNGHSIGGAGGGVVSSRSVPSPRGDPCRTQRSSVWVYHQGLLKLQIEGPLWPLAGDSGSAVVVPHDDGSATLVGLYIGGNQSAAYVIPAWQLFDARLYQALPAGAQLRPISI